MGGGVGEDGFESELMRLHNLAGPPRSLFTFSQVQVLEGCRRGTFLKRLMLEAGKGYKEMAVPFKILVLKLLIVLQFQPKGQRWKGLSLNSLLIRTGNLSSIYHCAIQVLLRCCPWVLLQHSDHQTRKTYLNLDKVKRLKEFKQWWTWRDHTQTAPYDKLEKWSNPNSF